MSEFAVAKTFYKGENRGELSFEEGEIIELKNKSPNGWWLGVNEKGDVGCFPYHTVEITSEIQDRSEFDQFQNERETIRTVITDVSDTNLLESVHVRGIEIEGNLVFFNLDVEDAAGSEEKVLKTMADFRVLDQVIKEQTPNVKPGSLPPMWADNIDMNLDEDAISQRVAVVEKYIAKLVLGSPLTEIILHHWLFPDKPVDLNDDVKSKLQQQQDSVQGLRVTQNLAQRSSFVPLALNNLPVLARAKAAWQSRDAVEISLNEGEIVAILETSTAMQGWWEAQTANGAVGLIPFMYVELMSETELSDFFSRKKKSQKEKKSKIKPPKAPKSSVERIAKITDEGREDLLAIGLAVEENGRTARIPEESARAQLGDLVAVTYEANLWDIDTEELTMYHKESLEFVVGGNDMVRGLNEAVQRMERNQSARIFIAPNLGYGSVGFPPEVPPDAYLVYDVTMRDILPPPPAPDDEEEFLNFEIPYDENYEDGTTERSSVFFRGLEMFHKDLKPAAEVQNRNVNSFELVKNIEKKDSRSKLRSINAAGHMKSGRNMSKIRQSVLNEETKLEGEGTLGHLERAGTSENNRPESMMPPNPEDEIDSTIGRDSIDRLIGGIVNESKTETTERAPEETKIGIRAPDVEPEKERVTGSLQAKDPEKRKKKKKRRKKKKSVVAENRKASKSKNDLGVKRDKSKRNNVNASSAPNVAKSTTHSGAAHVAKPKQKKGSVSNTRAMFERNNGFKAEKPTFTEEEKLRLTGMSNVGTKFSKLRMMVDTTLAKQSEEPPPEVTKVSREERAKTLTQKLKYLPPGDSRYEKYKKMLKHGMPEDLIVTTLEADGIDPASFFQSLVVEKTRVIEEYKKSLNMSSNMSVKMRPVQNRMVNNRPESMMPPNPEDEIDITFVKYGSEDYDRFKKIVQSGLSKQFVSQSLREEGFDAEAFFNLYEANEGSKAFRSSAVMAPRQVVNKFKSSRSNISKPSRTGSLPANDTEINSNPNSNDLLRPSVGNGAYIKYKELLSEGVPVDEIKTAMENDGLDSTMFADGVLGI